MAVVLDRYPDGEEWMPHFWPPEDEDEI